ncbi:MAG TPA: hypothetical protein VF250_07740 [Conexibacter sp.]
MAKAFKLGARIKPKKKCCKSGPRCKRCPAALRRLERRGLAERRGSGDYVIVDVVSKAERKAARAR